MGHTAGVETMADKVHVLEEHAHGQQKLAPSDAAPAVLASAAVAWTQGTIVQLLAAGAETEDYDVHWVTVSNITANADYEIVLYAGGIGAEVEIGRCAVTRNAVQSQEGTVAMLTRIQPGGTRLSASISSSTSGTEGASVKVAYHTY
jgi:hypothetical protein